MGGAALILLVGRADIIDIFLFTSRNGLANHTGTAVTAENHPAEQPDRFTVRAAPGIAFQHLLNTVKINLGDNRFVTVRYDRPLAFIFGNTLMDLIARRGFLALYENPGIDRVFENASPPTMRLLHWS